MFSPRGPHIRNRTRHGRVKVRLLTDKGRRVTHAEGHALHPIRSAHLSCLGRSGGLVVAVGFGGRTVTRYLHLFLTRSPPHDGGAMANPST